MAGDFGSKLRLSPTVQGVADELGREPIGVREIVTAILQQHSRDYAGGRSQQLLPSWPAAAPRRSFESWLQLIDRLWRPGLWDELFGRAVILGAALCDAGSGRAMEASGLFHQLALELTPSLREALTDEARTTVLTSLPLAAAQAGQTRPLEVRAGISTQPLALSGDSRVVVSLGPDGSPAFWDTRRAVRQTIPQPTPGASAVWANRDGGTVALSLSSGEVVLLSRQRAEPARALSPPASQPPANACVFSEDGRLVAVARGSTVEVFEEEGEEFNRRATLPHGGAVSHMALARDRLLSGSQDGTARLWDPRSGSPLVTLPPGPRLISVALAPSAELAATGDENGTVRLWDTRAVSLLASVEHGEPVRGLAFSPDGQLLASGGDDGFVKLWRTGGLIEIGRLPHGGAHVWDVAFDPVGTEVESTANDGFARRWTVTLEQPLAPSYLADEVRTTPGRTWIDDDVDAFARLIASRYMSPPLSIAVFGDWGSGKTFFMRRLRDRVGELAADARDSGLLQREVGYYKHIAQVEFNAWHYSNADLWASLVDNLFTQLQILGQPVEATQARVKALFAESQASDRATARAARMEVQWLTEENRTAEEHVKEIANREKDLREVQEKTRQAEQEAVRKFFDHLGEETKTALREAGFEDLGQTPADALATLHRAREVAKEATIAAALVRAPDRRRRLALLVAALLVPSALALLIHLAAVPLAELRDGVAAVAGVVGVCASAVVWLQRQFDWLRGFRAALTEPADGSEEQLRRRSEELATQKAAASGELELVQSRLAEARDRLSAAEQRLRDREAEIKSGNPAALLARLIGDRADTDYYRKHLGLLALVRRDFEALSDFVEKDRESLEKPAATPGEAAPAAAAETAQDPSRINRIVLYIDDLDRCPPAVVVRVLEAIHLLLSFPLFVVVVGVDVRWVSRALTLKYPDLLRDRRRRGPGRRQADVAAEGSASPLDYMEKIFQVPYWVEPLEPVKTRQLLQSLLGRRDAEARPGTVDQAGAPAAGPGPQPVAGAAVQGPAPEQAAARPPEDLSPRRLQLTDKELACMDEIAPLLVRSPRALKRFLNIYRLIRTRLFWDGFAEDRGPTSDFRITMLLLAIATGDPESANGFFSALLGPSGQTRTVGQLVVETRSAHPGLRHVGDWMALPENARWSELETASLEERAQEVIRYSFIPQFRQS